MFGFEPNKRNGIENGGSSPFTRTKFDFKNNLRVREVVSRWPHKPEGLIAYGCSIHPPATISP